VPHDELTIGRLAKRANVGIETIRYYQRRKLLPVPEFEGSFRHYSADMVDRIRFIKRAQDLGFTLDEVAELLSLQDGRNRRAIRKVATARLLDIKAKIADLARMEHALGHLVQECEAIGVARPCPIIAAFAGGELPAGQHRVG